MAVQDNDGKAKLIELDANGDAIMESPNNVTVQFNPETLRVTFAKYLVVPPNAGVTALPGEGTAETPRSASLLSAGQGTTRLSVQLWFDVTGVLPQGEEGQTDVRELTKKVAYFFIPQQSDNSETPVAWRAVRFSWGTFRFDGVMESLDETLEFFSKDGRPLRANMSLSLVKQEIQIAFEEPTTGGAGLGGRAAGTTPLFQAQAGASLQAITAGAGVSASWQAVASANGIENPRLLEPGQLINLNVSAKTSASPR
jgi:hypothetical protein